jgi:hypothetical protein
LQEQKEGLNITSVEELEKTIFYRLMIQSVTGISGYKNMKFNA